MGDEALATAVKFVGKDTVEGPLFLYGGPIAGRDAHGEFFTPETDFCLEWFGKSGRPALYEHGMDREMRTAVIGRQIDYEKRAEGIWAQVQLETNAKYRKAMDRLIEEGALGYSGGAMPHLATKDRSGAIKRFPWVETTFSPTPANPDNLGVYYVKSALALSHWEEAGEDMPIAALKALAEWADTRENEPSDGLTFAARADRLAVDLREFTDQMTEVAAVRGKSGRVLSAATRDRLAKHPELIRQVADDLDELLATADAGKSVTADLLAEIVATTQIDERIRDLHLKGLNQ